MEPERRAYHSLLGITGGLGAAGQAAFARPPSMHAPARVAGAHFFAGDGLPAWSAHRGPDWWQNTAYMDVQYPDLLRCIREDAGPVVVRRVHSAYDRPDGRILGRSADDYAEPPTLLGPLFTRRRVSGGAAGAAADFAAANCGNPHAALSEAPFVVALRPALPLFTAGACVAAALAFALVAAREFAVGSPPALGVSRLWLLAVGAKWGPLLARGDFWRFLTCLFLHRGVVQLLLTVALHALALSFERKYGFWRAAVTWLICGLYGSVLSAVFVPLAVTSGSSGAVFGWLAVEAVDMAAGGAARARVALASAAAALGIAGGLLGFLDNWAHLGGFVFGLVLSFLIVNGEEAGGRGHFVARVIWAALLMPVASVLFILTAVLFYSQVDATEVRWLWCYSLNDVIWHDAVWLGQ
jgi:membrane associated rhomboid family serine protease